MRKLAYLFVAAATAFCVNSCLDGYNEYKYTSIMNFEFSGMSDEEIFADSTCYFANDILFDALTFKRKVSEDGKEMLSGFGLCYKKDSVYVEGDPLPDRYVVFDCNPDIENNHFMVYRQNSDPTLNLSRPMEFYNKQYGTCTMSYAYVANTHLSVVRAQGEDGFGSSDHAEVIFTGYLDGSETGTAKASLFEYGAPIRRWTKVDLSALGSIDEISVEITATKDGIVEEFALDSVVADLVLTM